LVAAAAACVVLWIGSLIAAALGLGGVPLAVLAIGGFTLTILLLGLNLVEQGRLRDLAAIDPLTGLTNHRGFHEALARELDRARRMGAPVGLITLDLDDFARVNEAHGHPYGDNVLRGVGAALRTAIRNVDTAARLGGEEFALILPGASSEAAFAVAERAREAIEAIVIPGCELSCSAGIAAFPSDAEDETTLCRHADSAMRWAKVGGKRRTRRFDPDHSPATWTERQRAEIEELLDRRDPVTPVFQPVVSLATGRIVGFEALARFPAAGGRTPDVWFAQAHGCGLGPELEAAAIRAALAPVGRLHESHLAINVSPSALSSEVVHNALKGSLDGLIIEITEHEFVPDDESLAAAIADLRERGAKVAIDDAGAGHAGLKQLMRVQPDIVKIDRALVHDIDNDPARMALVESFVRYANVVGATVCAEGIETLDELAVLADLDVSWGQGWALARPEPPWAEVSPVAAEACRVALEDTFRTLPVENRPIGSSDRRLVHLSARLAAARTRDDLEEALALIAAELGATKVCLSAWHPHAQALETLAENGDRSSGESVFRIADYPLSQRVIERQEAVQAIVGDPESDRREVELLLQLGERSLLMIPVVVRGESMGIIEAYRADERPWSRTEINRARVIANQFASVIPTLTQSSDLSGLRAS
jgi:diguanylate cyclase (GGDEF)-like protein